VEKRIRSHPYLVAAWRQIKEYGRVIELYDPSMKHVFFYTGVESTYRPAVSRHHERVLQIELEDKNEYTISTDESIVADFYLKPAFGVVPVEMIEVYPAGHAEMPPADVIEDEAMVMAIEGLKKFLQHHSGKKFRIIATGRWKNYLRDLPQNAVVQW
jgi:7-cyano-7-deazaguanine tRNA-ribosyltransferase